MGGSVSASAYSLDAGENGGLVDDDASEIVNGTAYYGICCDRQAPVRGGTGNTCYCDGEPF